MEYMTVKEAAEKWGMTPRNVQMHCRKGNLPGVNLKGKTWLIPCSADKPARKPRRASAPKTVLAALKDEKRAGISGGLYHRLQIDFAFNSNHIEGSRLSHDATRWIFETRTIGSLPDNLPVDDVIEAANHFRCVDLVIESAGAALTESYIRRLHTQLKSGTSFGRNGWMTPGEYKRLDNVVGDFETCPATKVPEAMRQLTADYAASSKTLDDILDFHVRFETIHPFQDGNGRIGRLIMFKECLKHNHLPFIIDESVKRFYYLGLDEWRLGKRTRFRETCAACRDAFIREAGSASARRHSPDRAVSERGKSEESRKLFRLFASSALRQLNNSGTTANCRRGRLINRLRLQFAVVPKILYLQFPRTLSPARLPTTPHPAHQPLRQFPVQ